MNPEKVKTCSQMFSESNYQSYSNKDKFFSRFTRKQFVNDHFSEFKYDFSSNRYPSQFPDSFEGVSALSSPSKQLFKEPTVTACTY